MVNTNERDENRKTGNESQNLIETIRENSTKILNEVAKTQPTYLQSLSNLQTDYIETARSVMNSAFGIQKQVSESFSNFPTSTYTKQLVKQSNEITNNIIEFSNINNRFVANVMDVVGENMKNYAKSLDTITKFNSNIWEQWSTAFKTSSFKP